MMNDVLEIGEIQLDRTQVGTKCLFAPDPLRFDVSKSIPLFTTKYVNFRMILEELLWFLKGETDADKLAKKGINIWKPNTTREFLNKRGLHHYEENDIGSMYGWIWNHVGADYRGCSADYTGQGINQLQALITSLKTDPFSRRHLLTSYCPTYSDQGCLMPCHGIVTQFHVSGKRELSCHVYNRSQDVFLGQPFNVASYSILLYIIAAKCGYTPKELIVSLGNTHIYQNHEDQCKIQLSRVPLPLPVLELSEDVKDKDLKKLTVDDFTLVGYLHHAGIKAPMAI
jgi:thymidylate synthase